MALLLALAVFAQDKKIPAGSKVYIQPMDGFGNYLAAALNKKKVPLTVVNSKENADFEISGTSDSQKAGWAKILIAGSIQSREEASVTVSNLRSGEVVYAYNVNKGNAARGKQSAAEACAKHIKEKMDSEK